MRPALPAVANARLGFNNGYVDPDGVLRRYRFIETLSDGSAIQSIVTSVLSAIHLKADEPYVTRVDGSNDSKDELISWRKRGDAYPHISFADVFEQAEGVKPVAGQSTFAGKVVIVGATACMPRNTPT